MAVAIFYKGKSVLIALTRKSAADYIARHPMPMQKQMTITEHRCG